MEHLDESAMNLCLYGFLCIFGIQYMYGKFISTISDRAATEVSFKLLFAYRSDLMKGHIDNSDLMTQEEQLLITKFFYFLFGLHLLEDIAELMDGIFKQWESTRLWTDSQESWTHTWEGMVFTTLKSSRP